MFDIKHYTDFMSLSITKTKFTGFGSKSTGDGIYFCVTMEILSKGGIVFYDKKSFEEYERVFFDDSMCYGNVYCVIVKGIKKDTLYRYFNGEGFVVHRPQCGFLFGLLRWPRLEGGLHVDFKLLSALFIYQDCFGDIYFIHGWLV